MANATQSKWQAERLQPAISQRLKKTMVQGELAHAYLFAGPSGSGKKALAQWMALRLFCEQPQAAANVSEFFLAIILMWLLQLQRVGRSRSIRFGA